MHLLKNLRKNSVALILTVSIISHVAMLNFNAAEWGDSYRILRAAQLARVDTYPADEKRPPLFSLLISLYPENTDPLVFARAIMALLSTATLVIFYFYSKSYFQETKYRRLALILFWLNPVYFYWSLRVYADVPFSLYVLGVAYLYQKWHSNLNFSRSFFLAGFAALSVTLRFEGYLVVGALLISMLTKEVLLAVSKRFSTVLGGAVGAASVIVPYVIYRNPFQSSYFAEPAGRAYTLETLSIFVVSLLFTLGVIIAPVFFVLGRKALVPFLGANYFVVFFTGLSLILILLWPAAVPRLFVSIIPFLVLMFVLALKYVEAKYFKKWTFVLLALASIAFYATAQYLLKLQFLIVLKPTFVIVLCLNVLAVFLIAYKKQLVGYTCLLVSLAAWTAATLYIHQNIYKSISEASKYAASFTQGVVLHNDINSVADWYLNYYPGRNKNLIGEYINVDQNDDLTYDLLHERGAQYVIITNEHTPHWAPEFSSVSYLQLIKDFRYNVNSGNFITGVYKFNDGDK